MGKSKVSFVVFGLTLMLIICILSIIAVAVSNSVTTFSNGLTTEQLNISSTNTTRYIDVPKYSYVNNLSVNVTTPNLKEVLWMKLNALDIRTNNNTIYNTIGTTGTINGKMYNHGVNTYSGEQLIKSSFANASTLDSYYSQENAVDGDYNSYATGTVDGGAGTPSYYVALYSNFSNVDNATLSFKFKHNASSEGNCRWDVNVYCYNSSNQVKVVYSASNIGDGNIYTLTGAINSQCYLPSSKVAMLLEYDFYDLSAGADCDTDEDATLRVYDMSILYTTTNTSYNINSTFAKYGSAGAGFDGDGDYITVGNLFNNFTDMTISFWQNGILNDNKGLISKYQSTGSGRSWQVITRYGSNVQYHVNIGGSEKSTIASNSITNNTWNHIVAVKNLSHIMLYINSALASTPTAASGAIDNTTSNITIGNYYDTTASYNGSIDNVLIWNRSLSSSEITALYNSQNYLNASLSNGLVLQYTFEKTNSTHVFDENEISTGRWNESLSFDGVDDYVNMTTSPNITNSITISAWVYRLDNDADKGIVNKFSGTLATSDWGIQTYGTDQYLCAITNAADSNANAFTGSVNVNGWHQVGCVYNSTHIQTYYDGYPVGSATAQTGLINGNNRQIEIGTYAGDTGTSKHFNGSIDDVMIFNSSLDSSQVRYLYERQLDKYYPTNLNIFAGGTSAYSKSGSYNGSTIVAPNINSILANGCTCSGCSVVSTYTCRIPLDYYSDNQAYLINSLYNATYEWGVYNGSVGFSSNATALNFTVYDENNLTSLTLNSVVGTITINGQNFTTNYQNVNQFSVYIYPAWLNLSGDAYYQYTAGETERYYLRNISLSSQTGLINLYNFNGSDSNRYDLEYTTYNYFYSYYPNLIGKLQRYYPALNSWITVQIDQTDASGKLLYYIYLNSVDYRIRWEDDSGSLLYQTDPVKFICADGVSPCQDSDIIPRASESSNYDGMSWTPSYNNVTGIYSLSWTDSNNLVSSVTLLAQNENMDRVTTICNTTVESSSGTIVCNLSAYSGTITIRGIRTASPPNLYFLDTISKPIQQLYQILDSVGRTNDGIFLASLIQISFVGFGAMLGGAGCVLAGILGIIVISLFHLASFVTITLAVGITALGAVVMFIVKR